MIVKIERNRDTYICTNELGKTCQYNIVSHEAIGFSGKALKRVSNELRPFTYLEEGTPHKEFIDRLISLELISWNNVNGVGSCDVHRLEELERKCSSLMETKSQWKKTLENLRNTECRGSYSLDRLIDCLYLRQRREAVNLPEFKNVDFNRWLNSPFNSDLIETCFSEEWSAKAFAKWMMEIDSHMKEIEMVCTALGKINDPQDIYREINDAFYKTLRNLAFMVGSKEMFPELTYDNKKTINENCHQWKKDIVVLKNTKASERFKQVQTEKDYSFTSGDYTVTIPTSYADCQKISDTFSNCVAHYYWDAYLSEGTRLVVIINKNGVPTICCGIDRKSLKIVDYLKPHNQYAREAKDKAFRTEYQNYLKSLL